MGKEVMIDNIKGFPGYHITRDGLLYSRYDKKGRLTDEYHQNKIYTSSNGYQQAVLKIRKLNLLRRAYIHRLVAEAYISNPLNKPCVCHRDNIRIHNWVDNLYWGTYSENTEQASKDGNLNGPLKKLRFIVFSDLHLHSWGKYETRLNTAIKVLRIISDECMKYQVPALFCGDLLHESNRISSELAEILHDEFKKLDEKDWIMYNISGNHTLNRINRIDKPSFSWDIFFSGIYRFLKNIDLKRVHIGNTYIYGVPYIDNNIGLSEYLNKIKLVGDKKRCKHILMLHTDYPGAKDTDGREINSVENLNVNTLNKFDLVLCGHIHKPQRLSKKVYMIGAPYQQRRTDKNCKLGYWKLYSDLSMEFVELKRFPKFIDVEREEDIKDDGNYYTVIPQKASTPVNNKHKITKQLSKKSLAKRYLREKGIKDEVKTNLLIETLKKAESC
jgi:DNA repair exonuclease SbcCD nuclease subunit